MKNFRYPQEEFDNEEFYKEHGADWKAARLYLNNKFRAGVGITLHLSQGVVINGNKHSPTNNRRFSIGSEQTFSLEKEHAEEIRKFLSDPSIIVLQNVKDAEAGKLSIKFTRSDLIESYLKEAGFLIKEDFKNLEAKYAAVEEEKQKERDRFVSDEDMSEIDNLLAARSA